MCLLFDHYIVLAFQLSSLYYFNGRVGQNIWWDGAVYGIYGEDEQQTAAICVSTSTLWELVEKAAHWGGAQKEKNGAKSASKKVVALTKKSNKSLTKVTCSTFNNSLRQPA